MRMLRTPVPGPRGPPKHIQERKKNAILLSQRGPTSRSLTSRDDVAGVARLCAGEGGLKMRRFTGGLCESQLRSRSRVPPGTMAPAWP